MRAKKGQRYATFFKSFIDMNKMKNPKKYDPPDEASIEEKLIASIKKHSCLYNKHTINYRKRAVKEKAWEEVASAVGWSAKECQHRWRSLRDRYVREIRENTNCKWKYMNDLAFLNPHLRNSYANNTEEESCGPFDSLSTTTDHKEDENKKNQEGTPTDQILVPKIKTKVEIDVNDEPELEMEITDEEYDEIPEPNPMSFVALTSSSLLPTQNVRTSQNHRQQNSVSLENNESNMSEINNSEVESVKLKSRNEDYYKTLDSYMLQLPPSLQDDLKIEFLNRVYCEIKSRNISKT